METKKYEISGMSCSGCSNRVRKALEGISGDGEVKVDHTSGLAVIETNSPLMYSDIEKTISDLGYTLEKEIK